jgi:hypothetical protein
MLSQDFLALKLTPAILNGGKEVDTLRVELEMASSNVGE